MISVSEEYWDSFYSSKTASQLDAPSQFAVFVNGEIDARVPIVDIGCGTGRDALFFASRGKEVLGVDGSGQAVELCTSKAVALGYGHAQFLHADINAPDTEERLLGQLSGHAALYARFFVHAITDSAEDRLFTLAKQVIGDSVLAVEFRTARDSHQAKVTPTHFRRFVNPFDFINRAASHDLMVEYFVEGFGFAKFKDDDAHVAKSG